MRHQKTKDNLQSLQTCRCSDTDGAGLLFGRFGASRASGKGVGRRELFSEYADVPRTGTSNIPISILDNILLILFCLWGGLHLFLARFAFLLKVLKF